MTFDEFKNKRYAVYCIATDARTKKPVPAVAVQIEWFRESYIRRFKQAPPDLLLGPILFDGQILVPDGLIYIPI